MLERNSMFAAEPSSSLFDLACTEKGCKRIDIKEMVTIFSEKFGVSPHVFYKSEFLEERILKHALSIEKQICSAIPDNVSVTGRASWLVEAPFYESAFVVKYPGLSLQQREQIVAAYNEHYGTMASTYERMFNGGYWKNGIDGILINKLHFFKEVLVNMAEEYKLENKQKESLSL